MSRPTLLDSRPPKAMSSRLMTMKFMQRATASIPQTASQAQSQSQSQSTKPPSSKRQKTSNSPSPVTASIVNPRLIQSTLDEDEYKQGKVVENLAEDDGETKWILSTAEESSKNVKPNFCVSTAGYSEIDESTSRPALLGRMSFGSFNRELERHQNGRIARSRSSSEQVSETSGHQAQNSEDTDYDTTNQEAPRPSKAKPMGTLNRKSSERKQQKRAAKAELARLAEKRRKKEVKLNRLSSISGINGSGGRSRGGKGNMECYTCGEKGHERRDCPLPDEGKKRIISLDQSKI